MKSINHTLNGLASSLLLNVGLTSIAEKLDPMQNLKGVSSVELLAAEDCVNCIFVCNFTPEVGQ
jgi:hypothetical protein